MLASEDGFSRWGKFWVPLGLKPPSLSPRSARLKPRPFKAYKGNTGATAAAAKLEVNSGLSALLHDKEVTSFGVAQRFSAAKNACLRRRL